ncbi:glycosyltransferase [Natronosporangium hydrolyticum]|uniref:Glycosyltransferase n=1 Tax=Natronosporangium hydrolyticum TaxID=2811111 RepID=A0A895YG83_9ACTN|nr:glycosyltransferase [Natronosporangium hydrolyticum]QSB16884.1 glycosyltransferase [Natronosporangium hydrolyticum]
MHIVVCSTYPPRRCGLATFTDDLRTALAVSAPQWRVEICAVDRDGHRYGPEVIEVLQQDDRGDYRRAARAVTATGADLVLIQHEYGIFGGPDGGYVLDFASELTRLGTPYAVTSHTVLSSATPGQAGVLAGLCRGAAVVTGFSETARRIASEAGWVEADRFVVVPHGVPEALSRPAEPTVAGPALAAALAAAADDRILSTFGLLRPGKGLETAVQAMPEIVAQHPDVRYLIVGATHPETLRRRGEQYREQLTELAAQLGVGERVQFVDAFLSEPELALLLQRTELHLTPYRNLEQTCSGALTFALAAGCPVVSTPYRYAEDLVTGAGGPPLGVLVPAEDPAGFAEATCRLLADPDRLTATRRAAKAVGAELTWPAVGARFADVFAAAAAPHRVRSAGWIRPASLTELVADARVAGAPARGREERAWSPSPPPPASTERAS